MHKTVGCAVLWHLLSSVRREINFPANNFKHVFVFRTNRFIWNESRCHILFLFCDAFSISLSEGIAQDLPAKSSLSMKGRSPCGWHWEFEGLCHPGAGLHEGQCQLPWTRVWILEWWMPSSKAVCSPIQGWIFSSWQRWWGGTVTFGSERGLGSQRPWQSALTCPLPCPLILSLVKLNGNKDQLNHLGIFFKWFSKTGACNRKLF